MARLAIKSNVDTYVTTLKVDERRPYVHGQSWQINKWNASSCQLVGASKDNTTIHTQFDQVAEGCQEGQGEEELALSCS
jgi:hypothetical protein